MSNDTGKEKDKAVLGAIRVLVALVIAVGLGFVAAAKPATASEIVPYSFVDTVIDTYKEWRCDRYDSHNKTYDVVTRNITYRVSYQRSGPFLKSTSRGSGVCLTGHTGTIRSYYYTYYINN